jgi:hypothetical protein
MATSETQGPKAEAPGDSGLLVLSSDLVVETSMFTGKPESSGTSTSESQGNTTQDLHEDYSDLDELQFLRLEGVDRQLRRIVRIVGKFFPGRLVSYILISRASPFYIEVSL